MQNILLRAEDTGMKGEKATKTTKGLGKTSLFFFFFWNKVFTLQIVCFPFHIPCFRFWRRNDQRCPNVAYATKYCINVVISKGFTFFENLSQKQHLVLQVKSRIYR